MKIGKISVSVYTGDVKLDNILWGVSSFNITAYTGIHIYIQAKDVIVTVHMKRGHQGFQVLI